MKVLAAALLAAWLPLATPGVAMAQAAQALPRVVELKASDGVALKATYFSAGKQGPGVVLFHQANRTRTSWEGLARQLATAGINTLAVDGRGHGESDGRRAFNIKAINTENKLLRDIDLYSH
jgi:alpha-beta hydrolase superfamily lysophospholipase